jgi:NitT/TauT family transport system substrate-binding protein
MTMAHVRFASGRERLRPGRTRLALAALLLVSLALAAGGCRRIKGPAVEQSSVKGGRLPRVTMNLLPTLTYAGFMIAQEEGYFEAEGIEAEFVAIEAEQILLAAASGELDVASLYVRPGIFNTMLRGGALQIVADKGHSAPGPCMAEAFVAAEPTAERIAASGYRGARFVQRRGRLEEYLIDRLLEREKLRHEDVGFADLSSQEWMGALQDKLDVVVYTYEPRISMMLEKGVVRTVLAAEELDPGHQYSVVMFGSRLLKKEPELGRRFMRAYLRALRQYNQGKTDRNVQILSKYTKLPAELIRKACWVAIHEDGRVRPESLDGFLAWSLRKGYLDSEVPLSTWWNGTFIDEALASPEAAR